MFFSQNIDPALLWPSESAGKYDGPTTTMRAGAAVPMYQLHLWMVRNFLDAKTKTTGTKDLKNSDTAIIWIPNWQSQNGSLERTSVVGIPDFLPVYRTVYHSNPHWEPWSHGHMVIAKYDECARLRYMDLTRRVRVFQWLTLIKGYDTYSMLLRMHCKYHKAVAIFCGIMPCW